MKRAVTLLKQLETTVLLMAVKMTAIQKSEVLSIYLDLHLFLFFYQ